MLRKLIIFIVLSMLYSVSYAYMLSYHCANCDDVVFIPLAGSNSNAYASIIYFVFLPISILLCLQLIWRIIKGEKIKDQHMFGISTLIIVCFTYYIQSHIETEYKAYFAGNYTYENKEINYVMKNKELINQQTQHKAEVIGNYIHNQDDHQYFYFKNEQAYLVDFDNHLLHKLTKKVH